MFLWRSGLASPSCCALTLLAKSMKWGSAILQRQAFTIPAGLPQAEATITAMPISSSSQIPWKFQIQEVVKCSRVKLWPMSLLSDSLPFLYIKWGNARKLPGS